jgi:hypothetical protein
MRLRAASRAPLCAFLAGALSILATSQADAVVRISRDHGGQIGPYLYAFAVLRSIGESVIIDGPCLSACTLVLGVLPKEKICVTPRARLGFHAAWERDRQGRKKISKAGTEVVMKIYPPEIRSWIQKNGGLNDKLIYLQGPELATMYQACKDGQPASPLRIRR